MKVSFIIVAYNEEKTISKLFEDLKKQDYPHNKIEVILIDGISSDNTKEKMNKFKRDNNDFFRVIVKDNPKKTLPYGWNIALDVVTGELIIRVDAHSTIPYNFISNNVKCIQGGEKICGGYRPNIIDEETMWKKTLLEAETSLFGSSIAPYRRNSERKYVKSIFHGAYLKEVFDNVGQYNELLSRTEDNEMHYRMRKKGYKICFDPDIISYQHTRNTLTKMIKQKYMNGYWIGKSCKVCSKCFEKYHFVPLLFFISLIISIIMCIFGIYFPLIFISLAYLSLLILILVGSFVKDMKNITIFCIPIIIFLLHISYGVGTLIGIMQIPFWNIDKEGN